MKGARLGGVRLDLGQEMGRPGSDAGPVQGEIANEIVGESDRRDTVVGSFAGGGDGAGDDKVLAHVAAVVDTGKDQVRSNAKAKETDTHAIGGSSVNGVAVCACRFYFQRLSCGNAVTALRLLRGWSDGDDSDIRQGECRQAESIESVGVKAVVVGEKDGHGMVWRALCIAIAGSPKGISVTLNVGGR